MSYVPRSQSPRAAHAGFTLIELMVTLAIAAVLAMLAAPSVRDFIVRGKMTNVGNELTASILRSRNEAVTRNSCVTLCMSNATDQAKGQCTAKGRDWQVGWVAFLTPSCNGAANFKTEADTPLILVHETVGADILIQAQGNPPIRRMMFNSRGMPGLNGASEFDVIYNTVNNPMTAKYGFNICVDKLGRTRTVPTDKACGTYN